MGKDEGGAHTGTRTTDSESAPAGDGELNNLILSRPEGERFATCAEADTLGKLAAAIKKMETDVGITDLVNVGIRFIEWIRPIDLDKAKEVTTLWDKFIKDSLS